MERTHKTGAQQVILCSLVWLLMLGIGTALGGAADTPRKGGTLRVALLPPPSLDPHRRASAETWVIGSHFLEGLYTTGKDGGPIPMLAEGQTVSDDGLVYTFKLRRGVPFHNGRELTAADVVASLLRWGKIDSGGKEFFTRVESLQPLDRYTVQLRLQERYAVVLPFLGGAIYPKEVVEEAGDGEVQTLIGTGPFKVAEHQPGRFLKLVRFEQYQARPEPPNGYGGGKTAWVDVLLFLFLADAAARVAAVESGEADVAAVSREFYDRVKAHPALQVRLREHSGWTSTSVLNKQQGLFTNLKLRQAFLAALDMDVVLRAAYGHRELYRLDASLQSKVSLWWTDVGRELYNQQDKAKARRLLQEAGYQGEPMRYMTSPEYGYLKLALATKQQLEEVGFTVELQVIEWATLLQRMRNPALWDAYTTHMPPFGDPTRHWAFRCNAWGGWNCDPDFAKLVHAMETELQFEKRYRLWQDLQQLFWERVPTIHYGQMSRYRVMRQHVRGPFDMTWAYYWNVWLEQ